MSPCCRPSRRPVRSSSCTAKRKCMKPGPILRNPYLNFLRIFRKQNCGLSPQDVIRKGAKAWNALPQEQRLRFIREAFYATKRRRCQRPVSICARRSKRQKRRPTRRRCRRPTKRRMVC